MLRDGVYLHLPFDDYIAEPDCLGSTDKARLWTKKQGWWWGSKHNPFAKRDAQSDEQLFGECCHAALLEGMHAFESRFIVEPNKRDHPEALFTIPQIKTALKKAGVHPRGASSFTKEDWADAAEIYLPDQPVWENVMAEFARKQGAGRRGISAETDFAIRAMRELATEDIPENAEMRELLSVGSEFPILAEVSVFYTDDEGLRHRARFDKLLPTAILDLKTVGNWQGRELVHSVGDLIKRSGYDVQQADYQIARQKAFAMILEDENCIHDATDEERDHLIAMAHYDNDHRPAFAWIFYEKPTAAGAAPVLFPVVDRWGGAYHRAGFRKRHAALELYKQCMARFGPDRPWGRVEPVHYTDEGAEHHITLSSWDWGPDNAVEGEAEYFA